MADVQDLWVETQKGIVRADQIVHARVVGSTLKVTLSLIETDPTATITDINQVEHVLGTVSPDDGGLSAIGLADYISRCRAQGKRGLIRTQDGTGRLSFHDFDATDPE